MTVRNAAGTAILASCDNDPVIARFGSGFNVDPLSERQYGATAAGRRGQHAK
jgi:hypothetical protein